jgi:pimeloyl-ACP methyl ester carboxylesterase
MVPWATVAWGCSLAMIVGREGEWPWVLTRLVIVGVLLTLVLWAVRCRRWTVTATVTAGLVGLVVGSGIGVPHMLRSGDVVLASAGVISLLAGLALLICGATTVLRRRGRLGRFAGGLGFMIVTGLVALIFVPAVMATNVPATELDDEDPATFGLSFENVTFDTSDGVTLSAWYMPSTNDAAVVLRHGAGSTRSDVLPQAMVVARHGYGVLLADARGHGLSEGRAMDFGWFGDADISAAVTFLSDRPDVDPARIGVVGMSMGGEEAIGGAASDPRIRAVVAEGATGRTDADERWLSDVYGTRGTVQEGIELLRYSLADLLTSAPKPISLSAAIDVASSTPFLLIAAGTVSDERHVAENLELSAPSQVAVWVVPGSAHTHGLIVAPTEWEQRVVAFLDRHIGAGP